MTNQERINWMKSHLTEALQPTFLAIHDESHKHLGHEGAKEGAGHFLLEIASNHFKDLPLLACHRMIYDILGNAIPSEIHALKIKII